MAIAFTTHSLIVRNDESRFFELNLQLEFNSLAMCFRMICFCPVDRMKFTILGHTFDSFDVYDEYNFDGWATVDVSGTTSASNAVSASIATFSLNTFFRRVASNVSNSDLIMCEYSLSSPTSPAGPIDSMIFDKKFMFSNFLCVL